MYAASTDIHEQVMPYSIDGQPNGLTDIGL